MSPRKAHIKSIKRAGPSRRAGKPNVLLKRNYLIFSVFPLSGLCYRPYGLSPVLLTKKKKLHCIMKTLKHVFAFLPHFEVTRSGWVPKPLILLKIIER